MDNALLDQLKHFKDIISANILNKNTLYIKETSKSPFVYLDSEKGMIIFKGYGRPEYSDEFFIPIFDFIKCGFQETKHIEGHFWLAYNNSSFDSALFHFLLNLNPRYRSGVNVECYWYYEKDDDYMLSVGERFQSSLRIPFKLSEVEDIQVFLSFELD
jgi:hypothetical protein